MSYHPGLVELGGDFYLDVTASTASEGGKRARGR
jgi:hypothetical protein